MKKEHRKQGDKISNNKPTKKMATTVNKNIDTKKNYTKN